MSSAGGEGVDVRLRPDVVPAPLVAIVVLTLITVMAGVFLLILVVALGGVVSVIPMAALMAV